MWDLISKITNVLLGLSTLYFYLESRKLKSFEIDKEIEIKKLEIDRLESSRIVMSDWRTEGIIDEMIVRKNYQLSNDQDMFSGLSEKELEEKLENAKKQIENDKNYMARIQEINAEMKHLERLKKYKWIFSK